jgi:PAS domain S-box-containing protein
MSSRRAQRPGRKMMHPAQRFPRYAWPAVAVAGVVVTHLLGPFRDIPFGLFWVAVLLSAWFGGLRPALAAVVLSLLVIYSFFVPPQSNLDMGENVLWRSVRFVLVSGLLIWVTEARRRAEEALRESEERFRTFVDHATDAFFLHDDQLVVVDVNRQACLSLGYTRDELVGMTPLDFDPDVPPAMLEEFGRRGAAGEMIVFESRHRRKDGSVFPVEVRGRSFWEGGRRLTVSLARDISERERLEEELRMAHDRLELAVRGSNITIYEMNMPDGVLENSRWEGVDSRKVVIARGPR